jgi:hypothetical protein
MPSNDQPAAHIAAREEWERAYDEAMRWRDWQTCEILIDERETAEWWTQDADRLADESYDRETISGG